MNTSYLRKMTLSIMSLGVILSSNVVLASGGGATFVEGVNYLPMKPPVVVNYGTSTGKVKYIKAEISLRVESAHSAAEVSHHMPLIRDTLIMLMSGVSDEQLASGEGKEEIREEALAKVNEAIEAQIEAGMPKRKGKHKSTAAKGDKADDNHGAKTSHVPKRKSKKSAAAHGPVSDLLFDNLVVQK